MTPPPPHIHAVIPTIRRSAEQLGTLVDALSHAGMCPVVLANSASVTASLAGTQVPHHVMPGNDGFSQSINRGAALRDDWDWLFLCNDDVVVDAERLKLAVEQVLAVAPDGIVYFDSEPDRPVNGAVGAWLSLSLVGPIIARLRGHGRQNRSSWTPRGTYRSFSAVAIGRGTWDTLGPLDERMRFTYEDVDYARRAWATQIPTTNVGVPGIEHEHSASGSRFIHRVLPVAVWATVEYLTKWGTPRLISRALVISALIVRTPLVITVQANKRFHLRGVAKAIRAVITNTEPVLPRFEDL